MEPAFPPTASSSVTEERIVVPKDAVGNELFKRCVHFCDTSFYEEGFSQNGAEVLLRERRESLEISELMQFGDGEDHDKFVIHFSGLFRGLS